MELPKILIVDDDVAIRMLLRHTLASEPCQLIEAGVVHSAPSCAAAVAYMELGARLMAERITALTF